MPRKALNKKNLLELDADTLADLLLEVVKGDAARQRRVRMALSADQSPTEAAADIRKRFASLRRARSYISWKARRTLAKELGDMISLIETRLAPDAPDTAFDLLWALLHLAPSIYERTDDSSGTIGAVMDDAMDAIGRIAPSLSPDPDNLAETVFDALQDNGYGAFDGAIKALADPLGASGLEQLKSLAEAVRGAPLSEADLARYDFVYDPEQQEDLARDGRDRTASLILQDVADLQGDVDAWLSRYSAEQLTYHTIAPDAAARLIGAGRAEEALGLVQTALQSDRQRNSWFDTPELDMGVCSGWGQDDTLRVA